MLNEQGIQLVERVVDKVKAEGFGLLGHNRAPIPMEQSRLDHFRLPEGKPLSPSMSKWLAFDRDFLGWPTEDGQFPALDVAELARREFGDEEPISAAFRGLARGALPGRCLPLPFGSDSRRFLYLSAPDALGEYPVLLIDIDDVPFVCVEHPGLDVFLATHAGLLSPPERTYGAYAKDLRFKERMGHHIASALGGRALIELGEDGFLPPDEEDSELEEEAVAPQPTVIGANDPIPPGYVVDRVGVNPFTKQTMRFLKRKGS